MKAKISIIVPVYNVEKYLDKCLVSLVNQTYQNIEIIIVNDGTTDNSGIICEKYAKLDSRIKYFIKENGGLSDARNFGLKEATGDFIGFVDSDDWVDLDMYEFLLDKIQTYQAEIAICRYRGIYNNHVDDYSTDYEAVFSGKEVVKNTLLPKNDFHFNYGVINCLYRVSILDGIEFKVGVLNEDVYFTPKVLFKCSRCIYCDISKYNYLIERPGSIMNNEISKKRIEDELNGYLEIEKYFDSQKEDELAIISKIVMLSRAIDFYLDISFSKLQENTLLRDTHRIFKEHLDITTMRFSGFAKNVKFSVFYFFPKLYFTIIRIIKGFLAFNK